MHTVCICENGNGLCRSEERQIFKADVAAADLLGLVFCWKKSDRKNKHNPFSSDFSEILTKFIQL